MLIGDDLLYTEWLRGHKSLHTTLVGDILDVDISRAVGTVLGRSHAASHAELEIGLRFPMSKKRGPVSPQDQEAIYRRLFRNEDSFVHREKGFDIVQAYLSKRGNEEATLAALAALQRSHQDQGSRKALIHGDLTAEAVLVPSGNLNQGNKANLKVRGFRHFAYGPPGCDLGSYLASYTWYYASHAHPFCRRALRAGVAEVLSSYVSAFRAQAMTSPQVKRQGEGWSYYQDGILREACGYLGMALLQLVATDTKKSGFKYDALRENKWGDSEGRIKSIKERQVALASHALALYVNGDTIKQGGAKANVITLLDDLLKRDEEALLNAHQTEFWY